jgi:hypothetical protein
MTDPQHHKSAAPRLFQTLAADGAAEGGEQLSRTRKLFVVFITSLLFVAAPLGWAGAASGAGGSDNGPDAVLVKPPGSEDDQNGNEGPGGDGDDTTNPTTGTTDEGKVTAGDDADTGTGTGTRGMTGEGRDAKTGKETGVAKTDRAGLDTGVSTRGETDRGDKTGQTERR